MNVFRFIESYKEHKGKPVERVGFQKRVSSQELVAQLVVFLDHVILIEKINEITERVKPSSSS